MMKIRLRYISIARKPAGAMYLSWKRPGHTTVPLREYGLPAVPRTQEELDRKLGDPQLVARVRALNDAADKRDANPVDDTGSFRWLIRLYEQSTDFRALTDRTRQNYRYWLGKLSGWNDMPISLLDHPKEGRKLAHAAQEKYADKPHTANEIIATLKTLIDWAIRTGHMERNPAKLVRKLKTQARKAVWSDEAIATWQTHADDTLRLALLLGVYTGQRLADIISLQWGQISNGYIAFNQQKTSEAVQVLIHPDLATALEATPRRSPFVLCWKDNRPGRPDVWMPYTDNHFKHAFRRVTLAAGLDGLQFRDLRRTLLTRLSKAGATPQELADVSGHKIARSAKILDTYVGRNPGDAIAKLPRQPKTTTS